MTSRRAEIEETGRALVAACVAADRGICAVEARAMVDDALDRREASPHFAVVAATVGAILDPVIEAVKQVEATPDPHSLQSIAHVEAAVLAAALGDDGHVGP